MGVGFIHGGADQRDDMGLMVPACLLGQESTSLRADVGLAGVSQCLIGLRLGIVAEDSDADFVGAAFDSKDDGFAFVVGAIEVGEV